MNSVDSRFAAWIALEVLNPRLIEDPNKNKPDDQKRQTKRLIRLNEHATPWHVFSDRRTCTPNHSEKALYWFLMLGELNVEKAVTRLCTLFFDEHRDEKRKIEGTTPLAVIVLDEFGRPLENSIYISSFAWGYGQVVKGELGRLAEFNDRSIELKNKLYEKFHRQDGDGKFSIVDREHIKKAVSWLRQTLEIPHELLMSESLVKRAPVTGPIPKAYHFIRCSKLSTRLQQPQQIHLNNKGKYILINERGKQYEGYLDERGKEVYAQLQDAPNAGELEQQLNYLIQTYLQPEHRVPGAEFINSFYLNDLNLVRTAYTNKQVGTGLNAYVNGKPADEPVNVNKQLPILADILSPWRMPLTRWPGKDLNPLALMQQVGVNHAINELKEHGLIGINGPPGTGKTTLLRDLIAHVLLKRAIALSAFRDPIDAFTKHHEVEFELGRDLIKLYNVDPSLLGHEIVVGSSNNNAVENITKELPSLSAIEDSIESPLRYFQTISNYIAAGENNKDSEKTWGLIAAALGNRSKVNEFTERFWWSEPNSMRTYLKYLAYTRTNPPNRNQRPYSIVQQELPTQDPKTAWKNANEEFKIALTACVTELGFINDFSQAVTQQSDIEAQLKEFDSKMGANKKLRQSIPKQYKSNRKQEKSIQKSLDEFIEERTTHLAMKPGLLTRIVMRKHYRNWLYDLEILKKLIFNLRSDRDKCRVQTKQYQMQISNLARDFQQLEEANDKQNILADRTRKIISKGKIDLDGFIADDKFWDLPEPELQLKLPWLTPQVQKLRDKLFIATINLHKAFIDAAARPIKANLHIAIKLLKGLQLEPAQKVLIPSIWASLFLCVPVLSTTFASSSKLFKSIGKEQIGWLLIDEAGQAPPQEAIGMIWRAQRTVVIGDPLQVEPIATLPNHLISAILQHYVQDKNKWAAPFVSSQDLADRASWLGAEVETQHDSIWIGLPLIVHRRCEEPMFSISNRIAYNGKMINTVYQKHSNIGQVLGPSQWFHVAHTINSKDKWVKQEGTYALKLYRQLIANQLVNPDIYMISPFRSVADNLKELFSDELSSKEYHWLKKGRIGTIHTFQGKEAEAVILVLGASSLNLLKARKWAADAPNIINVAVTRAKQRLYVIGDHDVWMNTGVAGQLAESLTPLERDFTYEPVDACDKISLEVINKSLGIKPTLL